MHPCISIRGSVHPSSDPYVCPSVGLSVRFKNGEKQDLKTTQILKSDRRSQITTPPVIQQSFSPSLKLKAFAALCALCVSMRLDKIRYNQYQIIFAPYWLNVHKSADAPHDDLSFICNLHAYREVDEEVATAVLATMNLHLDYLRPDLAFLS